MRRRRLLLCLLATSGGIALSSVAAWRFIVPRLVCRQVLDGLRQVDPDVRGSLAGAGFGRVRIRDLSLGRDQAVTADSVEVDYRPTQVLLGRVGTVTARGVRWTMTWRDGAWDTGISPAASTGPGDLPAERIVLADAELVLDTAARTLRVPLEATVAPGAPGAGSGACYALGVTLREPVDYDSAAVEAHVDSLEIGGLLCLDATAGPSLAMTLQLEATSVQLREPAIRLDNLSVALPVTTGSSRAAPRLTTFDASWKGRPIGPARMELSYDDGVLSADGALQVAGGLPLHVRGTVLLTGQPLEGSLAVSLPSSTVGDPEALARLIGLDPGTRVGGRVGGDARARIAGTRVDWCVAAELDRTSIKLPKGALVLEGISGTVAYDSASAAPPAQTLTMATGRLGDLALRDVAVDYVIADRREIRVEHLRGVLPDGARVSAAPFSVDPLHPLIDTTLTVDDLRVEHWLPILTRDRARGEGRVSGRLHASIDPARPRPLRLKEGHLEAAPATGRITVRDTERFGVLLDRSDPRFATDETMRVVRQRILDAFADFRYDALRLELVDAPGDDRTLRITTRGFGTKGPPHQEIGGLTINVHKINEALNDLLSLRKAIDRAPE